MRKLQFIGILLLISTITFAQKLNKESIGFRTIRDYPLINIPAGIKSYAVTDGNYVPYPKPTPLGQSFNFQSLGLSRTTSSNTAEIVILFLDVQETMSDIRIVDERHKVVIGPNGKPVKPKNPPLGPDGKPKKEFQGRIAKRFYFSYRIEFEDQVVHSDYHENIVEIETPWFPNKKIAHDDIIKRAETVTIYNEIKLIEQKISTLIGAKYMASVKLDLYGAKAKKKSTHNYDELNNSVENFKEASLYLKDDEFNIEPFKEDVKDIIGYWEKLLTESDLKNEDAKINTELTAALYYNLAVYHILIKEFDNAKQFFTLADKTDKGFKDAGEMAKIAERWQYAKEKYENRITSTTIE